MLFVQEQYQYLVKNVVMQENFFVEQFENQEFILKLSSSVLDKKCLVIGSLLAPTEQAMSLLLLLHTLVQEQAAQVVLYAPYLGYQRQDLHKIGKSQGLLWADAMLHATGIQGIVTVESHCENLLPSLQVPVITQSVETIFDLDMANLVSVGFTFVFPDFGAVERSAWISELFPAVSQGYFFKKREHGTIELCNFQGKIGRKIIIYDDILDSGQTLIQVCIALKQMHVDEIVIFVAHAFFHGAAWNDLWSLGVKILFCTNSAPQVNQMYHPQIRVRSIMPLLQKYL